MILDAVDTSQSATGLALDGSNAYLTIGGGGLEVFDISVATHPVLTGGVDTPAQAYRVAPAGDYVYVAGRTGGLIVLPAQCGSQASVPERHALSDAERMLASPNPSPRTFENVIPATGAIGTSGIASRSILAEQATHNIADVSGRANFDYVRTSTPSPSPRETGRGRGPVAPATGRVRCVFAAPSRGSLASRVKLLTR